MTTDSKKKFEEASKLLTDNFGVDHGSYLLWNETCFPLDADECLRQAKELVAEKR